MISPGAETFQQFIEAKYLPYANDAKRPSAYKGYADLYKLRGQPHIGGIKLRDFRAVQAQRLLNTLAKPRTLTTRTLLRVKSFLCAVLSFAIREGDIQPPNPLHGRGVIVIEGGLSSEDTYAYDLTEIAEMLSTLINPTHQTAVTLAGFSGLSLAELRGLRWENIGRDG